MTERRASPQPVDSAMPLEAAASMARWSARHPVVVITVWGIALVLACFPLSRLTISGSLPAMLGQSARAAAATQRITSGLQTGDDLLVVAEVAPEQAGPHGSPSADAAKRDLAAFARRFTSSIMGDPAAAGLVATVHSGTPDALVRYAREVALPSAAFFLTQAQFEAALRKLQPDEIRAQISRNESLVAAAGPAAGALSAQVLRDPLRLFEVARPEGGSGLDFPQFGGAVQVEALIQNHDSAPAPGAPAPELSADERAILIRVGSVEPAGNLDVARRLVDLATHHTGRANTSHLRVHIGGPAAIAAAAARAMRRDALWATGISVALVAVLFAVFYRRWSAALLVGGAACAGMFVGVGSVAVFLDEVSPVGAMVAALLVGLGTDYGIHFLSHYDGARAAGHGSAEAAARTARQMAVPIATNCLTSIFGFASLWPSQIKMLSDFAALGGAGLLGALVAVFLLLPAVLSVADRNQPHRASGIHGLGRVADMIARRPRSGTVVCGVALATAVLAAAGQGFSLRLEPDVSVLHPRPNPALDATRFIMERFVGRGEVVPIEVESPSPEGLVAAAHDTANAIRGASPPLPGLVRVTGLHQLVPDPRTAPGRAARLAAFDSARAFAAFDQALDASAFDPTAYAGYRRRLTSLLAAHEPPTIADVMSVPALSQRVLVRTAAGGSRPPPARTVLLVLFAQPLADRAVRTATIGALTASLNAQPGATVAGFAAVADELDAAVRADLPRSVALSIGLVLMWLLMVFRRPLDVLLALLPLVFAGGTTVLFMMATRQSLNPINCIAIPLLDGIAVDAGVFLVAAARTHGTTRTGLVNHLRSTTHAVILAAATTFTAFMALGMSHTPAIRSLGMVASVGIIAALGAALLLLMPILILRASPVSAAKAPQASVPSRSGP
ncbi:MAG: MMPL family transporter [Phycisphaerales bacterium]